MTEPHVVFPIQFGEPTRNERKRERRNAPPRTQAQKIGAYQLAGHLNRRRRRIGRPGTEFRRTLVQFTRDGFFWRYHATKGWHRLSGAPTP